MLRLLPASSADRPDRPRRAAMSARGTVPSGRRTAPAWWARYSAPLVLLCVLLLGLPAGCGGGGAGGAADVAGTSPVTPPPEPATPILAPLAVRVDLGEQLFKDTTLSASGRMACASCHVQTNAHADAPGTFLPLGGPALDRQGLRASPSARYLDGAGAFRFNANNQPRGGLFWDGRADTRVQQAGLPFFNRNEMALSGPADLAVRLRAAPYFAQFVSAFALPERPGDTELLLAVQQALALYQAEDPDYHAFSSKYDAYLAGRAALTAEEARGLAVFEDPARGNCVACHPSRPGPNGAPPVFTDFSYHALGVPRNRSAATADPAFFDLGLCGPNRTDLAARDDLCGRFRVPTLRNVALTAPYFHNSAIATLEDAVAFYATRDTDPARWYPVAGGVVQRFNDLPARYQGNIEQGPPFNRRGQPGGPLLTPQDASDLVAFLRTLTDGFFTP